MKKPSAALKKVTQAHLRKFQDVLFEMGAMRKRQKLKKEISGKKKPK